MEAIPYNYHLLINSSSESHEVKVVNGISNRKCEKFLVVKIE